MNRYINLPPTAEGAKLNFANNEEYGAVYEESEDGFVFRCSYDPQKDYGEKCVILPLTSVYSGTEEWNAGDEFANVLESSSDHGIYEEKPKKWHEICTAVGIPWKCCEAKDEFYDCFSGTRVTDAKYKCDLIIIGGHVHKGRRPSTLTRNSEVYIIPICHNHNSKNVPHSPPYETKGNGNGFFMKVGGLVGTKVNVLKMTGYIPKSTIKECVEKGNYNFKI